MAHTSLPLVSVIIPVYNAEEYLKETLESIFAQTYQNIEVVAVDDGSQDGSIGILKTYGNRIRVIQQPNSGAAVARNRGVQEAKGAWIAFLDADDIWLPSKIDRQLATGDQYAWSYTDSIFMGGVNDGVRDSAFSEKPSGHVLEALVCSNFIGTSSIMMQRRVFIESGGFDESLRSIQDWDLWVRIAAKYPAGYVDAPLVKYRVHSVSASRSTRRTLPNHIKVIDKMFSESGAAPHLKHLKNSAKAMSYSTCAYISEEEGDYSFALACTANALKLQPTILSRWIAMGKMGIKFLLSKSNIR